MVDTIMDTLADTLNYIPAEPNSFFEPAMRFRLYPHITWLIFLVLIGVRVVMGIWSYKVGKRKGQELVGLLMGILLGLLGLILVYVLPDKSAKTPPAQTYGPGQTKCPHCSRTVPANSRFCPYCGRLLSE